MIRVRQPAEMPLTTGWKTWGFGSRRRPSQRMFSRSGPPGLLRTINSAIPEAPEPSTRAVPDSLFPKLPAGGDMLKGV